MKKLLLLTFILYTSTSFAQEKPTKKVLWGYKIGIASTGARSNINEISNLKNVFGYSLGIFADIKIGNNENVLFRPTIQFIRQGVNVEFKDTKLNPNTAIRESGISFPLGILYKFDEFEIGAGATSTLWFVRNSNYGVETTTGLNVILGYIIDEKTDIQLNYSFETKSESIFKRNSIGLAVLRYF
jgi:hypothetical protein